MELLETVRQIQPPPAPTLCRLLRVWKADCTMIDKEIKLVLETLKSMLSAWEKPKTRHQVWCGLDGAAEVGRLARELARACQTNKKPSSGSALSKLAEEAERIAEEEAGPAAKQPRTGAHELGALAFMEKKVTTEERLSACINNDSMKLSEWSVKMGRKVGERGLPRDLLLHPERQHRELWS
jgi:pheromone shutdown protein TraB